MAKIMVVDNEPSTVQLVKTILEAENFEVISALSGKECLRKLNKEKADLIILDIMMPELSGYDVFERIRKNDKKTPVMFLTVMFAPAERVEEFKKQGLCAYVTKPFRNDQLLKAIKNCLGDKNLKLSPDAEKPSAMVMG